MKHTSRSRERVSSSGKFIVFIACVVVGLIVKNELTSSAIDGETQASLQAQMGEPITKAQIPRPR